MVGFFTFEIQVFLEEEDNCSVPGKQAKWWYCRRQKVKQRFAFLIFILCQALINTQSKVEY